MTGEQLSLKVSLNGRDAPPLVLRRIPGGRFTMGSSRGLPFAPEGPEHTVEIRPFWMAESLVTAEQYEAVMGLNPSHFQGDPNLPVETVNWIEACEFCDRVSQADHTIVRLPTEAEWEYACRAGSSGEYHFGDPPADLSEYAWFEFNSAGHTAPVKQKKPNAWGIFDINGNVWEWCLDLWHEDYTAAPSDGTPWLEGARGRPRHCVRGGAWDMDAFRCRSSYRSYDWEEIGTSRTGFRVVADSIDL